MGVVVLSGCNLFTLDLNRYLGQEVATAGENISITKEDLRRGYSSFGYQFVQNEGYTVEQAVRKTLEILIDRALVLEYAKTNPENKVELTTAQENEAWKQVFEYFNSELQSLERELMKEKGMGTVTQGEASSSVEGVVYAPYEKAYYINSSGILTKIVEEDKVETVSLSVYLPGTAAADKATVAFNEFKNKHWVSLNSTVKNEAMTRFLRLLRGNEKGRGFSVVDAEVFEREIKRASDIYLENKVLEVFQKNYIKPIAVTNEQVVKWFASTYAAQSAKYASDFTGYNKAMQSDASGMLYHPASSEWFRVSHILLPYSDAQNAKLKSLKTDLANYKITQADYDKEVATINNSVVVTEYNNKGEKVGTKTAAAVLSEVTQALTGKDYNTRTALFNDFIYRYNTDPGVQNAEYNYYIPVDSTYDSMVVPFADTSRELHEKGLRGGFSGLVETEYGFHIIFYVGGVEMPSLTGLTAYGLDSIKLNALSNKTLLDKACESVALASYSDYETLLITQLKDELRASGHEIKIWEAYIKEL